MGYIDKEKLLHDIAVRKGSTLQSDDILWWAFWTQLEQTIGEYPEEKDVIARRGVAHMTRGERFTHARESAGMSLREASAISNVAKSTIVTLESEDYSDPKYFTVGALADCYGVEVRWLMEGIEEVSE